MYTPGSRFIYQNQTKLTSGLLTIGTDVIETLFSAPTNIESKTFATGLLPTIPCSRLNNDEKPLIFFSQLDQNNRIHQHLDDDSSGEKIFKKFKKLKTEKPK